MAANISRSSITTGATTISFTGSGRHVTVTNLDGAGIIYFRTDGTAASASDENHAVAAVAGLSSAPVSVGSNRQVSVIATATTLGLVELHD